MTDARNDPVKRTIYIRLTVPFSLDDVKRLNAQVKALTDTYQGQPHFVLADLRGVGVFLDVATVIGDIIEYSRKGGVRRCAHLSDSSIMWLQTRRLAREVSQPDEITVDVVSLEEAERLFEEDRRTLAALPSSIDTTKRSRSR